jgi:hypothetical protein
MIGRTRPLITKVYPGHGPATDIGTEKKGNEEVSATSVNIKN